MWNWSNPRHEALQGKPTSRSASEPDSASLAYVGAASLSVGMKPVTDDEATDNSSHRALRGGWGQRVGTDESRNLGGPHFFLSGSRTAHSSWEAGNDRGAKGLNVNAQL